MFYGAEAEVGIAEIAGEGAEFGGAGRGKSLFLERFLESWVWIGATD